jgi:hypothetical protein
MGCGCRILGLVLPIPTANLYRPPLIGAVDEYVYASCASITILIDFASSFITIWAIFPLK